MSKMHTIKGVFKMFWSMSKEDFREMDHKLLRLGVGVVGLVLIALFWLFFLSNIVPI